MSLARNTVIDVQIDRATAEGSRRRVAIGRHGALASLIRRRTANWATCRQLSSAMWKGLATVLVEPRTIECASSGLEWIFAVYRRTRVPIAGFSTVPSLQRTITAGASPRTGTHDADEVRSPRYGVARGAPVFLRPSAPGSPGNPELRV